MALRQRADPGSGLVDGTVRSLDNLLYARDWLLLQLIKLIRAVLHQEARRGPAWPLPEAGHGGQFDHRRDLAAMVLADQHDGRLVRICTLELLVDEADHLRSDLTLLRENGLAQREHRVDLFRGRRAAGERPRAVSSLFFPGLLVILRPLVERTVDIAAEDFHGLLGVTCAACGTRSSSCGPPRPGRRCWGSPARHRTASAPDRSGP